MYGSILLINCISDSGSIKYGRRHSMRRPLSEEKDENRWAWPTFSYEENK
jgi:hypothetical protein